MSESNVEVVRSLLEDARAAIAAAGCEIVELTVDEHNAFAAAVKPIYGEARRQYGDGLFALAGAD